MISYWIAGVGWGNTSRRETLLPHCLLCVYHGTIWSEFCIGSTWRNGIWIPIFTKWCFQKIDDAFLSCSKISLSMFELFENKKWLIQVFSTVICWKWGQSELHRHFPLPKCATLIHLDSCWKYFVWMSIYKVITGFWFLYRNPVVQRRRLLPE